MNILSLRDSTTYALSDYVKSFDVTLRENAVDSLTMLVADTESETFLDKCEIGDKVWVKFRFKDITDTLTQLFGGFIEDVQPGVSDLGELLKVTAMGYGVALSNMFVREQYGSQSENATVTSLYQVLTQGTVGIIPNYVHKAMGGAASGYTIGTTKIADIASAFSYLYFPAKPALNCLDDMIDLVSAANVPNAGCHWTVIPSGWEAYLCVATVGAHENPPADVWSTWWNTDEAGSTIEVKKDMIISDFRKKRSEANYVFVVGNFRRPANGDYWTESSASVWDCDANGTLTDSIAKVWGANSLCFTKGESAGKFWYPKTGTLNFDITSIGTKSIIPFISFYIMKYALGAEPNIMVHMKNDATHYFSRGITNLVTEDGKWFHITLPIGPYYSTVQQDNKEWLKNVGTEVWTDIDYLGFLIVGAENSKLWVDGLHIDGMITRAAYDSAKFASQKCKMMFIRDDIGKDDSLIATDDSGMIAQYAKAELYRNIQTPILGQIIIPMQPEIKAGQLAHIHFGLKSDGNFRIDKNMRIIEVTHHFDLEGAKSILSLTDDVKNSRPIGSINAYNTIMKAVSPGFQDRLRSSVVGKDVDVTQTILAKLYAT